MSPAVDHPERNGSVIFGSSKPCDASTDLLASTDSDYGFAPSWPAITLPSLLPESRVAKASTAFKEDRRRRLGTSQSADNPGNDISTSERGGCASYPSDAGLVTASQQQQQQQPAPAAQPTVMGFLAEEQQHLNQDHQRHQQQEQKRRNAAENNAHHPQHYCQREGEHEEHEQSTRGDCGEVSECWGKPKPAVSASGSSSAAVSGTTSSTTREIAKGSGAIVSPPPSPQQEQVSLPEDIYGAARVSEYWHGMHALSSLASSYVYDDIWAGDGGLNPREDIMGIAAWAASDVATGEGVVVEASKRGEENSARGARSPHPGSAVVSEGGSGPPRQGATGQRRRRKWSAFGCGGEGGPADDGEASRIQVDVHERVDDDAAAWDGRYDLGNRKRRTPSPGSGREREAGDCSTSAAAAAAGSHWSSVSNCGRGGGMFGREGRDGAPTLSLRETWKRPASSPQLSCGGSTSGASSGEDESFFAGRVLDPAPRPLRSVAFRRGGGRGGAEPDLSVDHPRGGGGRVGDDRSVAGAAAAASGRRRCVEGSSSASWPPEAAIAAAVAAGPSHLVTSSQRKSSHIEKEAFFSSHALDPSPRPDWHCEAFEESQTGDVTAAHSVAKGIVVHRLAQGIGASKQNARLSSEFARASSPQPRASPSPLQYPDMIGGSFRTAADARAWSRDGGKKLKERGRLESSGDECSGGDTVGNNSGGGNGADGSWDWQVQPEAMSAYFTNVIGLTLPVGGGGSVGNLCRSRSGATASSESLGRLSGVGGADTPGRMTGVYQDLGAAAGGDERVSRRDAGLGAVDSCSTSYLAEAESGSEEDNSWGW